MSVSSSGIGPATFRLVAQFLNQLRHLVPRITAVPAEISVTILAVASRVAKEVFALEEGIQQTQVIFHSYEGLYQL